MVVVGAEPDNATIQVSIPQSSRRGDITRVGTYALFAAVCSIAAASSVKGPGL